MEKSSKTANNCQTDAHFMRKRISSRQCAKIAHDLACRSHANAVGSAAPHEYIGIACDSACRSRVSAVTPPRMHRNRAIWQRPQTQVHPQTHMQQARALSFATPFDLACIRAHERLSAIALGHGWFFGSARIRTCEPPHEKRPPCGGLLHAFACVASGAASVRLRRQ